MKILVISHMYPSSLNPVYGIFVHKKVKALLEMGHEIRVISPVPWAPWPLKHLKKKWRTYASMPFKDSWEGVTVYYPRYPEFPRSVFLEKSDFFMYQGLKNLVSKIYWEFKFDLLHAHVALPDGGAGIYFKEKYRVPLVVTVHGRDFQSTLKKGPGCRQKLFEILAKADQVITVSSKLKNLVREQEFASKIKVVPNGINPQDFPRAGAFSDRAGEKRMVSVSNLKKIKGIDLNLKALAQVLKTYPHLRYTIVGEGPERKNLENLVKDLKLEDKVEFRGQLPNPKALEEMAKGDLFSLPSYEEGFGVVYLEAMALGLPTIGVLGEGIEDVITDGENGLLVRPRDVEHLAQTLLKVLTNPDLAARLGKAGRETVLNNFTWERVAQKITEIYEELDKNSTSRKNLR
jgi:teichuronic acid biosynthesis glycosyltransferase TuaC